MRTHNSGKVRNKSDPSAIPKGSIKSELFTPNFSTTLFVRKSCIPNENKLKVENQNPKNEASSSASGIALLAKSLN